MLEFCSPGGDSQLAPVEQALCLSVDRFLLKTDTKSVRTESQHNRFNQAYQKTENAISA